MVDQQCVDNTTNEYLPVVGILRRLLYGCGMGQSDPPADPVRSTHRRYAKGRAKRTEILHAALELIAREGYRRSTLQEIATRVGLTKAGVLHYFDSKEELFAEVLRLRDELSVPPADSGERYEADPLDRLVEVVGHNSRVPGLVQLYSSLSAEAVDPTHGAHRFFADRYRRLRDVLAHAIERARGEDRIRADVDAERLATMLVAVADGLQTQWLIDDRVDMADHVAYLLELVGIESHGMRHTRSVE